MEKKENTWVFMWSSLPTMPNYWATPEIFRAKKAHFPSASIFQYYDGKLITAYMLEDDLERYKQITSPQFLNPEFFKKYQSGYKKETSDWWNWIRSIEAKDYAQITPEQLAKDHNQFFIFMRDSISYFGSTRTEFTFAAEQRLEAILEKKFGNKWPDVFGILTTPVEFDDIQREGVAWLKLLKEGATDKKLLTHVSQYPWLIFGQLSEDKVLVYLRERAQDEKRNPEQVEEELTLRKKELKEEQQRILSEIDNADEAKYLAGFLQTQAVERMNIKSYWAGCYYLARNMWNTISEKLALPVWDVLMFVTPPEVEDLILGRYKRDINEVIAKRKKSYVIFYAPQGEVQIYDSEEADKIFKEKIKPVQKETSIKGQTASRGYYKGKVRKVLAGDLDMLQSSIKEFQKGEVLVTSMTQPNMMVLAERAGAIVTDEGGITSHAAIISRELKIPCIVGCRHAVEILKDGDMVEVDANNGIVTIIK
jgi:phosphohistidine swiveling domain-containing protein